MHKWYHRRKWSSERFNVGGNQIRNRVCGSTGEHSSRYKNGLFVLRALAFLTFDEQFLQLLL